MWTRIAVQEERVGMWMLKTSSGPKQRNKSLNHVEYTSLVHLLSLSRLIRNARGVTLIALPR